MSDFDGYPHHIEIEVKCLKCSKIFGFRMGWLEISRGSLFCPKCLRSDSVPDFSIRKNGIMQEWRPAVEFADLKDECSQSSKKTSN